MGRIFILLGVAFILLGLALQYAPWLLSWFGRLPGDIRIEGEKSQIFIPITSMIIISLVISLIINIAKRL